MKLLLLLCVLLFGVWLWRRGRMTDTEHKDATTASGQPNPTSPPAPPVMANMVQCQHCQVHLPFEEAVQGVRGFYCSPSHCAAAGDTQPSP